jgi:hypothetical protein
MVEKRAPQEGLFTIRQFSIFTNQNHLFVTCLIFNTCTKGKIKSLPNRKKTESKLSFYNTLTKSNSSPNRG